MRPYFHSANRGQKLDLVARENLHPGETRWTPPEGWNGYERI